MYCRNERLISDSEIWKAFTKNIVLMLLLILFQPKPQPETPEEGEEHHNPPENPNRQLRHLLVIFVLLNIWGAWHFLISYYRTDMNVMVGVEVRDAFNLTNTIQISWICYKIERSNTFLIGKAML